MNKIKMILLLIVLSATVLSCASRKKRKCNTCPKWTQTIPAPQVPDQFYERC